MKWHYTDYPVLKNGKPVLTSGDIDIKMTKAPRLATMEFGSELCTIPRPVDNPYCQWEFASDVSDDLKRFVKGKYWFRIDAGLMAEFLRARGMAEAAMSYERSALAPMA